MVMKKEYESLIYSEKQLVTFYNTFFSQADPFYTDFFCLAARKKYMTEEQKRAINLGDTCMMFKTILKEYDVNKFLSKIKQADASASFFTDRDGNYIPRSCFAFYMNINKTNVLKAIKEFKDQLNCWEYDLTSAVLFNNTNKRENLSKQIKTVQNDLLKSFQDPKNVEGPWVDIDCDIGVVSEEIAIKYKEKLMDYLSGTDVYIIRTHGGCHIVFDKTLISSYNRHLAEVCSPREMKGKVITFESLIEYVRKMVSKDFSKSVITEIKYNQNLAVPIPGTLQGGFPVSIT